MRPQLRPSKTPGTHRAPGFFLAQEYVYLLISNQGFGTMEITYILNFISAIFFVSIMVATYILYVFNLKKLALLWFSASLNILFFWYFKTAEMATEEYFCLIVWPLLNIILTVALAPWRNILKNN
jgi:hypothetical protein